MGTSKVRKLTKNQAKTIEVLRKLGRENSPERAKIYEEYKKHLEEKIKEKSEETISIEGLDKLFAARIKATIPITSITDATKIFLETLIKDKNAVKLIFASSLTENPRVKCIYQDKNGEMDSVGVIQLFKMATQKKNSDISMSLDGHDDGLKFVVQYPTTPSSLIAPAHRNQGDLAYRARTASSQNPLNRRVNERSQATQSSPASADNPNQNTAIDEIVRGILFPEQEDNPLELETACLDNVEWHDFSEYLYALEPHYGVYIDPNHPGLLPDFLDYSPTYILKTLEDDGVNPDDLTGFNNLLKNAFEPRMRNDITGYLTMYESLFPDIEEGIPIVLDLAIDKIFSALSVDEGVMADLAEMYWILPNEFQLDYLEWIVNSFFENHPYPGEYCFKIAYEEIKSPEIVEQWASVRKYAKPTWKDFIVEDTTASNPKQEIHEKIPGYEFSPFLTESWNLGLRLTYRQEWRSLGNQRGEIVKTIPLGPKQVERISTKIVKRKKISRTSENLTSVETTTETSETTKDSSEIIEEASKSFGWNVEAEASAGWGWGSAKMSAGMHGDSANKSRDTSSSLSETMQKTASKTRTETKVVVSTESETTFESTTASEIYNPNEEIALTYVYSKLQRQYEIFTNLAEVQNVVMIAESVPAPRKIDETWVKRYDWIIAKALLDDSFREALTLITQDETLDDMDTTKIDNIMGNASTNMAALASTSGNASLSEVDVIQEPQRIYRDTHKENLEKQRNRRLLLKKKRRLLQHIRDNILHYCRAIWSQEDPQQRYLRIQNLNIKIPMEWDFIVPDAETVWSIDEELLEKYKKGEIPDNPFALDGKFVSNPNGKMVNLADLINLSGPIGYHGNYAIYLIKPEYAGGDTLPILDFLKVPYSDYDEFGNPCLVDPYLKKLRIEHEGEGPKSDDMDKKWDMVQYVPELRLAYTVADRNEELEAFFNKDEMFIKYYPEYLFRKEQTRRFLLDTNNLMIDILPGKGSALEKFKLAHRGLDVLKAIEEKEKLALENERRRSLIATKNYGDPDIEKVTLVTGDLARSAALVTAIEDDILDSNDHE